MDAVLVHNFKKNCDVPTPVGLWYSLVPNRRVLGIKTPNGKDVHLIFGPHSRREFTLYPYTAMGEYNRPNTSAQPAQ